MLLVTYLHMFHYVPLTSVSHPFASLQDSSLDCLMSADSTWRLTWRLTASSGSSRSCDISLKRFCCCDIFWSSKVNLWISSCRAQLTQLTQLTADCVRAGAAGARVRDKVRKAREGTESVVVLQILPRMYKSWIYHSFIGGHLCRVTIQKSAFKKHRDNTYIIHLKVRHPFCICALKPRPGLICTFESVLSVDKEVKKQNGSAEKVPSL